LFARSGQADRLPKAFWRLFLVLSIPMIDSMTPRRLYLDNAATSFPKPPSVTDAMVHYAQQIGASAGRGAYAEAIESGKVLERARAAIARLINSRSANHVIFTLNCTDALNLAMKGLLAPLIEAGKSKPHVICSATDHNSILRPLTALADCGQIELSILPIDSRTGLIDLADLPKQLRPTTKLIAITHASNVTGAVQPIREVGLFARQNAIPVVVDAAQSIGHLSIDVERDCIDLLAAPGHKALMGPLGTGFLYLRPGMEKLIRPLREGGTGSRSDEPRQPAELPDKYESGSHNTIGIAGLLAGVEWILERGIESLAKHERELVQTFVEGLSGIEGLEYFGPQGVKDRVGVFSVRIEGFSPKELADLLEARFGILTRPGIHCAPLVHKTLGTVASGGTTRFSVGVFTSVQDVRYACDALAQIAMERTRDAVTAK
jgi:cysteine desulfurase family protein